jgi:flagellar FliL protein
MAGQDLDLDVEAANGKTKRSGMVMFLIGVLVTILLVGATVATLYFTGVIGGKDAVAEQDAGEAEEQQAEVDEPRRPQIYYPLEPAFVVNFNDDSDVRFMQVTLQIATRDPAVIDRVKEHTPAIRNNLVMLFSNQDPAVLNTREGKQMLRTQTLEEVQKVLEEQTGEGGVENVYFTSFVMQ